jgi:hypothetical protein
LTRTVFLGIFATGLIAQFVGPVGDMLEGRVYLGGALLSFVGFVLYDQVRELSSAIRTPVRVLVNSSDLGSFVSDAFRARNVEISFLGYTGETLYHHLYQHLAGLERNQGTTRQVLIRMLVPDFSLPMLVPSRVNADGEPEDDEDFRRRIAQQCSGYDDVLSGLAAGLTATGRVQVRCEYRVYAGIPREKICIFNRKQVLHGLYDLSARMPHMGNWYFDPKGYATDLSVYAQEGSAEAAVAVSTWNDHFDDLWALSPQPSWRRSAAA